MLALQVGPMTKKRSAFSLAELVISIGVLVLMMGLAGQVFSITIKSTGQATALTEVTQQLRVFEETLREDLRNVQPGQSVMVIEGNPVNAYWSQVGKESDDDTSPKNGYGFLRDPERERVDSTGKPLLDSNGNVQLTPPRADILMFFTARKATSQVNPAVSSRVQQVVYGHANLGEYSSDPDDTTLTMSSALPAQGVIGLTAEDFAIPAQQWHLARRSSLVLPNDLPPGELAMTVNSLEMVQGAKDVYWGVNFVKDVLQPQYSSSGEALGYPWFLPVAVAPQNQQMSLIRSELDTTPPMMMANRMGAYFLPNCASFKVEWSLDPRSPFVDGRLDGTSEVFWFDPGDVGDTSRLKYKGADPLYSLQRRIDLLKEESDPASEDLRNRLESLLCEQVLHADGSRYSLADRFRGVMCDMETSNTDQPAPDNEWEQLSADKEQPNIAAFTASRPHVDPSILEPVPDDIWPAALRITVDLYDREGRMERPIRHVMIIPVGG